MKKFLSIFIFVISYVCAEARIPISAIDPFLFGDSLALAASSHVADSLKGVRKSLPPSVARIKAARELGDYYLSHRTDSAFIYWNIAYDEARALGLEREATTLRLKIDSFLPFIGMGAEALADFSRIDPSELDRDLRRAYYLAACELHYNLASSYPESRQRNKHMAGTVEAIDSLLSYYRPESPIHRYLDAFRTYISGNRSIAAATLVELLPDLRHRPTLYVSASKILADFYRDNDNRYEDYINYLLDANMVSLRSGMVRPSIMAELGGELYRHGDHRRGVKCISLAFNKSDDIRGMFELRDVARYTPMLATGDTRSPLMRSIVTAMLVLIIAVLVILTIVNARRVRRQELKQKAQMLSYEQRLAHIRTDRNDFLSLAFMTQESLKNFAQYAQRKLTAGQAKDLFNDLEKGTYMAQQNERFFEEFDERFLRLEEHFVERLNRLLRPDQQLELQPGGRMTPELRIAALMSLGFTDSSRIASVLGLSLNTVYTYRNRLKGRAIDRATFESSIQNITEV